MGVYCVTLTTTNHVVCKAPWPKGSQAERLPRCFEASALEYSSANARTHKIALDGSFDSRDAEDDGNPAPRLGHFERRDETLRLAGQMRHVVEKVGQLQLRIVSDILQKQLELRVETNRIVGRLVFVRNSEKLL